MWQWLQRLFGGGAPPANADPALIDRLVEIASTRIKMADNYRYRLAPLVAHACEQIREFEEKLPAFEAKLDRLERRQRFCLGLAWVGAAAAVVDLAAVLWLALAGR